MLEKKILNDLHKINLNLLEKKNDDDFFLFFKSLIISSHIFIRIAYKFLIWFLIIFFILIKFFFLSKENEFYLFSKIIILLNKVYFLRDILKFIKVYSIIFNYE